MKNILEMEDVQTIVALSPASIMKRVYSDGKIEMCVNVKDATQYIGRICEMIERKHLLKIRINIVGCYEDFGCNKNTRSPTKISVNPKIPKDVSEVIETLFVPFNIEVYLLINNWHDGRSVMENNIIEEYLNYIQEYNYRFYKKIFCRIMTFDFNRNKENFVVIYIY